MQQILRELDNVRSEKEQLAAAANDAFEALGAAAANIRILLRDEAGTEVERFYFTGQRHVLMVRQFAGWVQGDPAAEVVATLEQAEPHLLSCNGASEATTIRTVPASEIEVVAGRVTKGHVR